ncbi:hypothetical protein EON80_11015 [bacterium]|nr:MAG: hypothetical protein EON80_11015 [bacterium]
MSPRSLSTRFSAPSRSLPLPFLTRDASWMRFMARAALTSWLLPLLFALLSTFTAAPAHAQAPAQTVVVLDFAVSPGLDPLLGRKAADGLAVELQRSGDYEVVTRQRVEEAVGQQAGLQPPFNDTAQIRLAQAVGARGVFSGRVVSVDLTPGRAARVRLETKQLDAATGDFVNGTQVSEVTEQKLQDVANEILVDEAINKSVFSAVRSMRQTTLPEGAVLNTTRDDVELSIGARNGVVNGQRYSVLRDVFNRGKQLTERVKIGELTITSTQSDQAIGVLSAGGAAGVRTGDRIRQIFVPVNYPITATGSGGSMTPVNSPPVRGGNEGGIKGVAKRSSQGLLGLVALAGLVGLAGFGGGSNSSAPSVTIARDTVVEKPLPGGDFGYTNNSGQPLAGTISFTSGFDGFSIAKDLQAESVVGYIIYRGTSPSFSADITNMQGFLDGRNDTSKKRITFSDPPTSTPTRRLVVITASGSDDGGDDGGNSSNNTGRITISDSLFTTGSDTFGESTEEISLDFTQRPVVIGQTYYYRVARITAERVRESSDNNNGNNGGTGGNTDEDVTVRLLPVQSKISSATGGYTALVQPRVLPEAGGFNTDNFSVRVNFDPTFYSSNFTFTLPNNVNVGTGTDQFRIQVSTSNSFSEATTFTSNDQATPPGGTLSDLVFNLENIRIPSTASNPYVAGETPLYVRALMRNTSDQVPTFRVSQALFIGPARGIDSVSSRFLASPSSKRGGGVNILGNRAGRTSGTTSAPPRVLAPR